MTNLQTPEISIVVPVFYSQDCLEVLVEAIDKALSSTAQGHEIILVNDGSHDNSWQVIERLGTAHAHIVGINHRRNFGQDNAIMTGLRFARGKYVVIMDDDLQHNPADIPAMLGAIKNGRHDVVYACFHEKRCSLWKRVGSWLNGKTAEWLISKPPAVYMSPYKILRADMAKLICDYEGPYPYVDGLLFQVTDRFSHIMVEFHARYAGEGTYTFRRSLSVWARLAFSFSIKPLRLVTWMGFMTALLGFLGAIATVIHRIVAPEQFNEAVAGWTSLIVTVLVLGGVQMIFLGVLGEYVGRTHLKVSRKPQATVAETINAASSEEKAIGS